MCHGRDTVVSSGFSGFLHQRDTPRNNNLSRGEILDKPEASYQSTLIYLDYYY